MAVEPGYHGVLAFAEAVGLGPAAIPAHDPAAVLGPEPEALILVARGAGKLARWVLVATAMLLSVRPWQRRELAPPWRGHFGMLLAGPAGSVTNPGVSKAMAGGYLEQIRSKGSYGQVEAGQTAL